MDAGLLASLTNAEREHAAGLLDTEGQTLESAVARLFSDLSDPLLSASDVQDLIGAPNRDDVLVALAKLTETGVLEYSEKTQRPFDAAGVRLYRLAAPSEGGLLRLVALESLDQQGRRRYQFTLNGRLIRSLARIDRLDALDDTGNQRGEIRKHVEKIAAGISSGTFVPSPVLLVLLDEATQIDDNDDEVDEADAPASFVKVHPFAENSEYIEVTSRDEPIQQLRLVILELPYRKAAFDDEKSVLLVDGQQRTAALSLVSVQDMPSVELAATAVVASPEEAKRIFQVANDTVKISTDFSRALLASMAEPPGYLKKDKVRADAVKRLALVDEDSPFKSLVKHPGTRGSGAIIAYNSLFSVVGVFADGFPEEVISTTDALVDLVKRSYLAVKATWPEAWGIKPTESRLMHGVGLRSVAGLLVYKLASYLENGRSLDDPATWELLEQSLQRLSQRIVWTLAASMQGTTALKNNYVQQVAGRQNTAQDIQAVTDFLRKESLDLDMKAGKGRG
jgi:DGQHR domain-containing protein